MSDTRALMDAVVKGDLAAVKQLIAQGVDSTAPLRGAYEWRPNEKVAFTAPLHLAGKCRRGLPFFTELVKTARDVNVGDDAGWTPLHHVLDQCSDDVREIVQLLVTCGADPNALASNNQAPLDRLHWKAKWSPDVLRDLVDAGADIQLTSLADAVVRSHTRDRVGAFVAFATAVAELGGKPKTTTEDITKFVATLGGAKAKPAAKPKPAAKAKPAAKPKPAAKAKKR